MLKRALEATSNPIEEKIDSSNEPLLKKARFPLTKTPIHGILIVTKENKKEMTLLDPNEAILSLGLTPHTIKLNFEIPFKSNQSPEFILNDLYLELSRWLEPIGLTRDVRSICIRSINILVKESFVLVSWLYQDEDLALQVNSILKQVLQKSQ